MLARKPFLKAIVSRLAALLGLGVLATLISPLSANGGPNLAALSYRDLSSATAAEQIAPDIVSHCKKATALVVLNGEEGYASAFCIDPTGLFVTNSHVIEHSSNLSLVLSPGEKNQERARAKVVLEDKDADLALLKVDDHKPLTALELGDSSTLTETAEVAAFGYPFGIALAVDRDQYPSITVSIGHVTSLRKVKGVLKQIRLDASLNPGNSGGPVIDAKGKVVGVVVSGIKGTGINFAIPVQLLRAHFRRPILLLAPPDLSTDRQGQKQDFTIQVISLGPLAAQTTVELILTSDTGESRTYPANSKDGRTFHVSAVPFPANSEGLLLTVSNGDSEVVCRVRDLPLSIDGKQVRLRLVKRIEYGRQVTMTDGTTVTGTVKGLDAVETRIAGAKTKLNLSGIESVMIEAQDTAPTAEYRLVMQREGRVVGELTGVFVGARMSPTSDPTPHIASGAERPIPGGKRSAYQFNPVNQHWYCEVDTDQPILWTQANAAASAMNYKGLKGHMVTLTSAEKSDFVIKAFPKAVEGNYWLGGYKDTRDPNYHNPESGWHWVTGEPWQWTNWNQSPYKEPNGDFGGPHSDFLQFWSHDHWNDQSSPPHNAVDNVKGYLVEFEK